MSTLLPDSFPPPAPPPSERRLHTESISSMKTTLPAFWPGYLALGSFAALRATSKSACTSFSDSPCHLLPRSDVFTEKNLQSASVATALASCVLPVPGGP